MQIPFHWQIYHLIGTFSSPSNPIAEKSSEIAVNIRGHLVGQRVPRGKRDKKDGGGEYLFFNASQIL